jgi:hypothetical protein
VRYAPPASVRVVRARSELATRLPTPAATTAVIAVYPTARPATAGSTDRGRRPAAIVKAQSAPGTAMSSRDVTQNPTSSPTGIHKG